MSKVRRNPITFIPYKDDQKTAIDEIPNAVAAAAQSKLGNNIRRAVRGYDREREPQ